MVIYWVPANCWGGGATLINSQHKIGKSTMIFMSALSANDFGRCSCGKLGPADWRPWEGLKMWNSNIEVTNHNEADIKGMFNSEMRTWSIPTQIKISTYLQNVHCSWESVWTGNLAMDPARYSDIPWEMRLGVMENPDRDRRNLKMASRLASILASWISVFFLGGGALPVRSGHISYTHIHTYIYILYLYTYIL